MLTRRRLLGSSLSALLLAGCGYPYTVLKQATPNPLAGQKRIGIAPVSIDHLTVDSGHPEAYRPGGDHEVFMKALSDAYQTTLLKVLHDAKLDPVAGEPSDAAPIWIRPRLVYLEPGMTLGAVYDEASHAKMQIDIIRPDGTVLDTVAMEHWTRNERNNLQAGDGLKSDGEDLAAQTYWYVWSRIHPG